jgi:lipopolysaccharide transport system permease protein
MTAPSPAAERVVRLGATRSGVVSTLREVWEFHELLFFLVWRDVKVRYKQTSLGAAWAILQPVASMLVFSVIFGHLVGIKTDYHVPYPLFLFAGLLPWTYFSSSLGQSSTSLVSNSALVTKVFVPRLILPIAAVLGPLFDFLLSFSVLIVLFIVYGELPTWRVVFLPLFVAFTLLTALGVGLWLSALNVRYRDVPYTVPFLTQLWLYATPVVYPVSIVPERWQWVLALNPLTGVIDGFRWALLSGGRPHATVLLTSAGVAFVILTGGFFYFRRTQERFADVI